MIDGIPVFSEKKLQEILHYTDLKENPVYKSFKSNTFFELHSGAKGVSKSFGQAIISIYRLVNDKRFCSVWCRNQYNHIKKTLRPMFEKVLSFLKNEHNLDYTNYISIYDSGLYWEMDDGGKGRAIYFENFEKIQAFQGITLKNNDFLFGELVIDEPIEDPADTTKLPHQLEELYRLQEQKLPLLISNTVARLEAPETFQIKVKFLYNIFTTEHWIIKNFHNKVITLFEGDKLNEEVKKELENKSYIQKIDETFKENLGISCTMYSKYFIPKKEISEIQLKYLENLKTENHRMWVVTVLGFAFEDENNKPNYFMHPYIFNENNTLRKDVQIIKSLEELEDKSIIGIYDGFDPGLSDKSAWVRTLLLQNGKIVVWNLIDDFGSKLKEKFARPRTAINNLLVEMIKQSNEELKTKFISKLKNQNISSILLTDNDIICETIGLLFNQNKVNAATYLANRKDSKSQKFGIESRQNWQKWLFKSNNIIFLPHTLGLTKYLAKQMILPYESKRDETINKEIYDLVNAFEMSCSTLYKYQYYIQNQLSKLNQEI
ncbi:hypothetical protein PUW87_01110 [Metamycoplasma hyosynoviae]|uniref:hypothetical protein n=1 Tax=Metamycoplasma hyosynoviae TaxID=29559 RepID=UPI00236686B0|nr:hypothetical protein [Metamycoplasma hyosynoviae]MDD7893535.1 hypothetical protein [Metamycoplasma hyosynoviae]MDD7907222.1 hypothetical protein [Metamycoplasma hyosynoviae]